MTIQNCEFRREKCIPLTVSHGVHGKEPYHRNIKFINNKVACKKLLRADTADRIVSYGNENISGKKFIAPLLNCTNCDIRDAEIVPGEDLSHV